MTHSHLARFRAVHEGMVFKEIFQLLNLNILLLNDTTEILLNILLLKKKTLVKKSTVEIWTDINISSCILYLTSDLYFQKYLMNCFNPVVYLMHLD